MNPAARKPHHHLTMSLLNYPIPAFEEYIPAAFVEALNNHNSTINVPQVPGLKIVGGIPDEFKDILAPGALSFVVDLYRQSLSFKNPLAQLLAHRKMKRQCINNAALTAGQRGGETKVLCDIPLEDGTVALGTCLILPHHHHHQKEISPSTPPPPPKCGEVCDHTEIEQGAQLYVAHNVI